MDLAILTPHGTLTRPPLGFTIDLQFPAILTFTSVAQTGMLQQGFWLLRHACPFQIAGAAADNPLQLAERTGNQCGISQRTDANRHINAFANHIGISVSQLK